MKKNKILKIGLGIAITIIIIMIIILNNTKTTNLILGSELSRTQAYEEVKQGDEEIVDGSGNVITAVQFDAFFLRDKDGDGVAESIRGTCNPIGSQANMYMELSVLEKGYITNGKITINSNNFYFNTTIVKDNEVKANYISPNTKEILLNDISNGSQKMLIGSVRSGNYSSASEKTAAIGNDTNKYSIENSVTFSGTFVDSSGNETPFTKTVPFIIDWHGEVDCEITPKAQTVETETLNELTSEEGLTLNFDITTAENKNQLIMESSNISGTIPELNGYKPISVKISGSNVEYTYDEETGNFTAQRTSLLDENGIVTSNAYTASNSSTKYNEFEFTIIYPIESYQEMGEDVTSLELAIPIEAVNKGYNNSNEEDGFVNPYISNQATGVVVTTWKKPEGKSSSFNIYVGTHMGTPYNTYVISKKKPLNIYNGISLEEKDDTYLVQWRAYTGTNGITDGIIMNETTDKTDNFLNTSATYISMEDLTTNKGIYFNGATETLGTNGWIKIYDAETDVLIKTFTSSDWNKYTATNPYNYQNKIKHIRIETSSTNASSYFYVYNIKELDDTYITEKYPREEFDNLAYIYSYLDGYMIEQSEETEETSYWYKASVYNKALYAAPTSIAEINIKENTISTHTTAENELITISTVTSGYNSQGWKNGTFLVQLPSEIILAEVNSVITNNENVTISAYDVYEENGYFYIKILTENENEETFDIIVDCDLTPDPRIAKTTKHVKLYAINEIASDYYYSDEDEYDIDGDSNITEQVNYRQVSLTLDPGSSLSTTQTGSNYGDDGGVTIAPRVAKTDKDQRTAKITISSTNNYSYDIQDIKILGVIPFEGNDYVISGQDLGSTFTTTISETGITTLTQEIEDYVTIYYSINENPNENLDDISNGWTLAENVTDWSAIKTYIIVLDSSYELATGEKIEFEYEISLPKGIDYNEVTYSEHAIYFALATEEGLYYTSTASAKLGFMIAKQYDLEIVKYQKDTEKRLQGVTFTITEDGADTSTIKVTNQDGVILVSGLYVERYYTIKEQKTTEDYVLNEEEIRFYTYTEINEDGTESLYISYPNNNENTRAITDRIYYSVQDENIFGASPEEEQDYKIQIKIENEVKAKLAITKTDIETGNPLKNIKFTLTGEGYEEKILTTDKEGKINISGLYLDSEYTLQEVKATGYYIPQTPIKFTITNNNGTFNLNYTDNGTTKTKEILVQDEIPTINLDIQNEKIPTYGLQLTKYAKGEKDVNGNDKTLQKAQYIIHGEGISENGKIYTTDENGILTIDNLYEFVDGKYITGEYTLTEIYAPEGYSLNSTSLKFKAYRENGTLKIKILEGEDVIRTITDETIGESTKDLNIVNSSNEYPLIQIGVEDSQIFTLFKYYQDGTTSKKVPIPGTKFMITDLNGNYVIGSDGKIIGELDEAGKYLVTTDENGLITANLPEGLYKAVEIYTPNRYYLEENEADRTYYFGIGASKAQTWDWVNGITGNGWNYINSVEATNDGGVISVGSFSEYSIIEGVEDGIDINKDGVIDKISLGNNDGIIVFYNADGNYVWAKSFGGDDNDVLNKIIQTSDGGYVAVGYVSSTSVQYDGKEITELSKSDTETNLANKDGIILKLDSNGNYEWGIRLGGTAVDEIKSVIETSENNFVISGTYYSSTFNLYETSSAEIKDSFENKGKRDAFIASYSEAGKYQWSQRIGGIYNIDAADLTEYESGLAVAVNAIGQVYTSTSATSAINTGSTTYQTAMIIGYKLDGTYSWHTTYRTGNFNNEMTSIDTQNDGTIIAGINFGATGVRYDAKIYKITSDGTSATSTLIYTLTGTYDEYVSDVTPTSDGGILFGGWYYSTDTNGDGGLTFAEKSGEYASDAYVIKLDSSGQVSYSSRLYGDNYDGVTSVTETKGGNLVSGGYFNSSTFSATNCEISRDEGDEGIDKELMLTRARNSEGFVIAEGAAAAEVPEAQSLQVENKIKAFKITTQVIKNSDVFGGEIDGETDVIYDGVEYTKDGIRYLETVDHGENSKKEIKITPDANYVISYIKINNEQYTNFTIAEDGTVTIPIFEQVTKDIHIVVEFSNSLSNLEVNHYLWNDGVTTGKVAESEYYTGNVGDSYTALPKTDIDYEIITNEDYYGSELPEGLMAEDYYIPNNYTGTYQQGTKVIVNYYYKEKSYKLTVHHYLEGTNEAVPLKGSTTGEKVEDEFTDGYVKGDQYTTSQATDNLIDYSIYELAETPINANGTIEENTEITYYYKIKEVGFNFTKVAEENHSVTISNTEFKLYQFVGVKDEFAQDEMIDIKNVSSDWKLVDTYISSSTGNVKLQGLPITSEYRLVETKSADGRLIPEGQWKIEFIYADYDENDTSIVKVNGTTIRITAVGNPPALVLTEGGELLLPNKQYYKIPSSGGLGSNDFLQIGIVIVSLGIVLLFIRKAILKKKVINIKK